MASPVALANEEPLPVPVGRISSASEAERPLADTQALSPERARSLKKQASAHVTPYQALPIQGPLVEPRLTPSYPILEPDEVCALTRQLLEPTLWGLLQTSNLGLRRGRLFRTGTSG